MLQRQEDKSLIIVSILVFKGSFIKIVFLPGRILGEIKRVIVLEIEKMVKEIECL